MFSEEEIEIARRMEPNAMAYNTAARKLATAVLREAERTERPRKPTIRSVGGPDGFYVHDAWYDDLRYLSPTGWQEGAYYFKTREEAEAAINAR